MWEELKTFIEVVEQQSFTKAAQKLNISAYGEFAYPQIRRVFQRRVDSQV